jgi:D-glycero-D-manno-heptose 1,7-bisphosphate phosphatase
LLPRRNRHAVFFDRDGVLNEPVSYPLWGLDSPAWPRDLRLYPDACTAIQAVRAEGYVAVLASNQPGIAKGKYSRPIFEAIDRTLTDLLAAGDTSLDGRYYCLHHPEAVVASLRTECNCRKPRPGLILQAVEDFELDLRGSYLIGDSQTDVLAAEAAGCESILLLRNGHSEHAPVARVTMVADLNQAVALILGRKATHVA